MFIYDDGPIEDYTKTFPIHREFDAPACVAAIANAVGTDGYLSADQLRDLEGAGWEILSHTVNHCALDEVTVTRDVAPRDERVYVENAVHGRLPNPILISDGESSITASVDGKGEDDRGEYLELDGAVGAAFDADDGVTERYTDEVLRYELGASKELLTDLGLSVSNFVCPYYRYGDRAEELASDYYVSTANGHYGGINEIGDITLDELNRTYFRTSRRSLDGVGKWLDKVAEGDHLGLLGGHSYYDTLPAERIRETLRMTRERNIEIKTLREALSDLGAVTPSTTETASTPTRSETPAYSTTSTHTEASVHPETSEYSESSTPRSESPPVPDERVQRSETLIPSLRTFVQRVLNRIDLRRL